MLPAGHYLRMLHIRLYVACILLVRKGTLFHPFILTSQTIIQVSLFTIIIPNVCVSVDEVLYDFGNSFILSILESCICFVNFLLEIDFYSSFELLYAIHILGGFNHLSVVIKHPYNVLGNHSLDIVNQAIISYEPLLHRYN